MYNYNNPQWPGQHESNQWWNNQPWGGGNWGGCYSPMYPGYQNPMMMEQYMMIRDMHGMIQQMYQMMEERHGG